MLGELTLAEEIEKNSDGKWHSVVGTRLIRFDDIGIKSKKSRKK